MLPVEVGNNDWDRKSNAENSTDCTEGADELSDRSCWCYITITFKYSNKSHATKIYGVK